MGGNRLDRGQSGVHRRRCGSGGGGPQVDEDQPLGLTSEERERLRSWIGPPSIQAPRLYSAACREAGQVDPGEAGQLGRGALDEQLEA